MPTSEDFIPDSAPRRGLMKRGSVVFSIVIFLLVLAITSAGALYERSYRDRVYQGVDIGGYALGGLDRRGVVAFIESINNRYAKEGTTLAVRTADGADHQVKFNTVYGSGDTATELLRLDGDRIADQALAIGRDGGVFDNAWRPIIMFLFRPFRLAGVVTANAGVLRSVLQNELSIYEQTVRNAGIRRDPVTGALEPAPEQSGLVFDYPSIIAQLSQSQAALLFLPIPIRLIPFTPQVTSADINRELPAVRSLIDVGPLILQYSDTTSTIGRLWTIPTSMLATWAEVRRNDGGNLAVGLNANQVATYLDAMIRPWVDVAPQEAKFSVAPGGKVEEFETSRVGLSVNGTATDQALEAAFLGRNGLMASSTVPIVVNIAEPKVTVGQINNLGIAEVLGVGISTFKDSHTNRIKNIAHAADRLNGVLIKPGEEFSTIRYAGPFTADNGYLPEQVIKGKDLKLEVGGGMCQIGTTMFRMAMNSGLPVTQRHNHSLVVGYYADPVNHNPGTDATIYEPSLDFRFLNDTGSYLLLSTVIDYQKQQLTFTLWGKSDGRKGWYSHPTVSKWIQPGDPENILVDDGTLKPGETKCQGAFRGAVASFTYTRVTSSSEAISRVFDSYYRPLPKICMTGVAPGTLGATSTPVLPAL